MGKQKQSDLCESLLGFTGFLSTCEKALTKHGLGFRFDLRYKLCVFSRFAYANWTGEESGFLLDVYLGLRLMENYEFDLSAGFGEPYNFACINSRYGSA